MSTNFPFNLLSAAQSVIRTQDVDLYRFSGRTSNAAGKLISTYEPVVSIKASVQPVSRSMYQKMGLDFEKTYITVLAVDDINDLGRDRSGDQIVFDGNKYEVVGQTEWKTSAGWNRVVCVKVASA